MGLYKLPKIIGKDNKPPFGARINRDHPLSQGLVGAWLFNEGGGSKIFSTDSKYGDLSTTTIWQPFFEHPAIYNDGQTNHNAAAIIHDKPILSSCMTVIIRYVATTSGTQSTIACNNPNTGYRIFYNTGDQIVFVGGGRIFWSSGYISLNSLMTIAFEGSSIGIKGYLNGKYIGTDNTGAYSPTFADDSYIGIHDPAIEYCSGYCVIYYVYNRVLSASEHASLHANPYQMFWPVVWDAYFVPAAAPPPTGGRSIFGYDSIFHAGGIIQT